MILWIEWSVLSRRSKGTTKIAPKIPIPVTEFARIRAHKENQQKSTPSDENR